MPRPHPRELSLLVAARHWDAQYSWNAHVDKAVEAGIPAEAVRAPGPVALTQAADEAIERAKANGVGTAAVRRTVHTGAIGYYTSRIAAEGQIGLAFVAGMPNMGYPGVQGAAVATSPLSIAVPAQGRPPVLLDMATAMIALGKIAQYRNSGEPLPEGAAATAEGVPTTDPGLAKMPLPLGGAKGAGMSLVFELLTSVLVQAPILSSFHSDDPDGRVHRQNALLLALDPAAFGDGDGFPEAAGHTLEVLKGLPSAEGTGEVHYPGERSAATEAQRSAQGVPVGAKVWADVSAAAERLGVAPPPTAGAAARS